MGPAFGVVSRNVWAAAIVMYVGLVSKNFPALGVSICKVFFTNGIEFGHMDCLKSNAVQNEE
jgi:type IV secretory pathway TrbL component